MSERLTILEVHLGDSTIQFGPRTLGGTETTDADETTDGDESKEEASGGFAARSVGGVLLAVVGLAVLGAVARKRFGGTDIEAVEELDELVH